PDLADNHSAGNGVEGFSEGFGADAELPDPVLIDLDVQVLHRLVPVEIDEPRIRVLPDCLGDEKRCLARALLRRAADAVLQRPADWRPQFQRVNPGVETGELAVQRLFQPRPDTLTLLDALSDDNRLGEIVIGQLHVQRQVKAYGTLPD